MIQQAIDDTISPLRNTSSKRTVNNIPSISDYAAKITEKYDDRYLHNISHVKIDGEDVVIYTNDVVINNVYTDRLTHELNGGICTMSKELLRIPKNEVKELIVQLMYEDE